MTTVTLEPQPLTAASANATTQRYAKTIEASKRIRWDIDRDVIRGRRFDFNKKFLPDGLSKVNDLAFLAASERQFLSQVQGRSYANMFALVERFIGAKHQELFRRLDALMAADMPAGYTFLPQPDPVAQAVLSKGNWAVLALTLHIELFTLSHYRSSIDGDDKLSEFWKDVFRFHWLEESQHAILDELELRGEHARCDEAARERGVTELIELVGAVDGILQVQAQADAEYFGRCVGRALTDAQAEAVHDTLLRAYRWQYIVSGAQEPRFVQVLGELLTPAQMQRIGAGLAPLVAHVAG
jgi:hypothetical protein